MPRLKTPVLLSYSGWSPGVFFRFQNLWSFHLKSIINRTSRFSSPMIPGKWEMDKTWVKPLVTNQCQIWNDVNWWSWKSTWNLGETIAAIGRSKALKMDSDVLWCLIHPGLNISECLPLLKGSQKSWVIIFSALIPKIMQCMSQRTLKSLPKKCLWDLRAPGHQTAWFQPTPKKHQDENCEWRSHKTILKAPISSK